jgi:hypothetical protein
MNAELLNELPITKSKKMELNISNIIDNNPNKCNPSMPPPVFIPANRAKSTSITQSFPAIVISSHPLLKNLPLNKNNVPNVVDAVKICFPNGIFPLSFPQGPLEPSPLSKNMESNLLSQFCAQIAEVNLCCI